MPHPASRQPVAGRAGSSLLSPVGVSSARPQVRHSLPVLSHLTAVSGESGRAAGSRRELQGREAKSANVPQEYLSVGDWESSSGPSPWALSVWLADAFTSALQSRNGAGQGHGRALQRAPKTTNPGRHQPCTRRQFAIPGKTAHPLI